MTKKFDEFVKALDTLCREHEVQLDTTGYDLLVVRDRGSCVDDLDDLDGTIYGGFDCIEDRTEG